MKKQGPSNSSSDSNNVTTAVAKPKMRTKPPHQPHTVHQGWSCRNRNSHRSGWLADHNAHTLKAEGREESEVIDTGGIDLCQK